MKQCETGMKLCENDMKIYETILKQGETILKKTISPFFSIVSYRSTWWTLEIKIYILQVLIGHYWLDGIVPHQHAW